MHRSFHVGTPATVHLDAQSDRHLIGLRRPNQPVARHRFADHAGEIDLENRDHALLPGM